MENLWKVFERIEGYREEIIAFQEALTSRPALGPENGGSGEHDKAAYLFQRLRDLGPASLEEIRAPDDRARDGYRPNLIARWEAKPPGPRVWVLSHTDIVPPGDLSLWESDPFQVRVEGDRLFGRGVEDNQHGIVSSFIAVQAVLESGIPLSHPVGLALVADEETGSLYGLAHVLKSRGELFGLEDLIIVPDGGNAEGTMIEVAEKSILWLRFTVKGRQCHASTPQKGRNSLYGASRLIVALQNLKKRFDLQDPLFRPPYSTFEPTRMMANVPNTNTIPGKDVFHVDCRVLPQYPLDEVLRAAGEIAGGIAGELDLRIEVEPLQRQDATAPTPADAPVVEALKGAVRVVTGRRAEPMGIGGGTVAAFFRRAGLPAAVWSTDSDLAHQPNESCLISNIINDAKVFACLYLGGYKAGCP